MATAEQMKALLSSYVAGDNDRFLSTALQIAASEAKKGHVKAAQDLRSMVERARSGIDARKLASPIPIARPRGDLAGLLSAEYPTAKLHSLVVSTDVREHLERVLVEQRHVERLRSFGLSPRRKLMLVGPPGTGKTLSSGVLAGELGLPLFVVRLDGLIMKFMGETSAKLRQIFDALASTRGVYLFDEFDAIGGTRLSSNDVGEARRIVTSFLQMVEQDRSDSLIVAATNHVESLDTALFRRFDDVIHYGLPEKPEIERLMRMRLSLLMAPSDLSVAVNEAVGLSHAEIVQACDDATKDAIINERKAIHPGALLTLIRKRKEQQYIR